MLAAVVHIANAPSSLRFLAPASRPHRQIVHGDARMCEDVQVPQLTLATKNVASAANSEGTQSRRGQQFCWHLLASRYAL